MATVSQERFRRAAELLAKAYVLGQPELKRAALRRKAEALLASNRREARAWLDQRGVGGTPPFRH